MQRESVVVPRNLVAVCRISQQRTVTLHACNSWNSLGNMGARFSHLMHRGNTGLNTVLNLNRTYFVRGMNRMEQRDFRKTFPRLSKLGGTSKNLGREKAEGCRTDVGYYHRNRIFSRSKFFGRRIASCWANLCTREIFLTSKLSTINKIYISLVFRYINLYLS